MTGKSVKVGGGGGLGLDMGFGWQQDISCSRDGERMITWSQAQESSLGCKIIYCISPLSNLVPSSCVSF